MKKTLVRNKQEYTEVLSDSEFIKLALIEIANKSTNLANKEITEETDLLDTCSDILELINAVIMKENINPKHVIEHSEQLRIENGSFIDKKAKGIENE